MTKNKLTKIASKSALLALALALSFAHPASAQENAQADEAIKANVDNIDSSRFYNHAILQLLNKTTAKTSVVDIKIGEEFEYGKIVIIPRKCWQAPLDQKPDSRILLEILEKKSDGSKPRIFFGWMISSSPSIASLEHPIYDVVALNCKSK